MANEGDMGNWTDLLHSSTKLLEQAAPSAQFPPLQLLQLLLKASQDKRFVCEEADRALSTMVGSLTPLPLLYKLRPYVNHFNLRVRAKAVVSISNCVSKMGLENMKEFRLASLLQMAVELLNYKLPEAREAVRRVVVAMYERVTEKRIKIRSRNLGKAFARSVYLLLMFNP